MAGLVPGDDAPLVLGQAARLHAGDDALERLLEVVLHERLALAARAADRGLVADVRQVGAGQAAGLAGDDVERRRPRMRLVTRVHLQHTFATPDVGRRDEDLAVEAAGAQQGGVQLLEQVGSGDDDDARGGPRRSRPSRPAAG